MSGTLGKLLCEGGKLTYYKNAEDSHTHLLTAKGGFSRPAVEIIEVETDGLNLQHNGIINNFTAAILGKEEQFVDGKEGIFGVELMNAIELSGWKGGEAVSIPVDEDEYLEELNKRRATSRLKVVEYDTVENTAGTYGGKA